MNADQVVFWMIFAVVVGGLAYHAWLQHERRHEAVRDVEGFGTFDGLTIDVAVDGQGRKHISLHCWLSDELDLRVLVTPDQALKLARMLEVAASPGRNVAQARWNRRHAASRPLEAPRQRAE